MRKGQRHSKLTRAKIKRALEVVQREKRKETREAVAEVKMADTLGLELPVTKGPQRLHFPQRVKGEAEGAYKFRKFEYFCEHYARHVAGKYANKAVRLMPWQSSILKELFSTLGADGKRIYKRLFIHVARKNGKSFLVSLLILYFLAEESFYDMAAELVSVANTRDQSIGTIFRACRLMVGLSPELSRLIKVRTVPPRLTNYLTNAVYEPLAADAKPQLGRNISFAIFDETLGQPNGDLWDVMSTSQSMREEPLLVSISTAGPSRASFYWTLYERMKAIEKDPALDPSTLVRIYEVPEDADWRDPKNFLLANPAMGPGGFRPESELLTVFKSALDGEGEGGFRQYYLNQWAMYGQRTLVPLDRWDACRQDLDLDLYRNCRAVAGLDWSCTTDLTGLALIIELVKDEPKWAVFTFCWLAGENLGDCSRRDRLPYEKWVAGELLYFDGKPTIQVSSVLEVLGNLKGHFANLSMVGFDPYGKEEMAPISKFFDMMPVPQNYAFLSPALKLLKKKILEKNIVHDGDPVLRSMIENARVISDPSENIKLDKSRSVSRIDGLVAVVIGCTVAMQAWRKGTNND